MNDIKRNRGKNDIKEVNAIIDTIHELFKTFGATAEEKTELIKKCSIYNGKWIDDINNLTINGYKPSLPRIKVCLSKLHAHFKKFPIK